VTPMSARLDLGRRPRRAKQTFSVFLSRSFIWGYFDLFVFFFLSEASKRCPERRRL